MKTTRAEVESILQKVKIDATGVIFDVTSTVLYQGDGSGFSPQMRQLLRKLADRALFICAATGDSLYPVIEEQFLTPLEYRGERPIFLITGSGGRTDAAEFESGQLSLRSLDALPPVDPTGRQTLLRAAELVIQRVTGTRDSLISAQEEQKMLAPGGGDRVDISGRIGQENFKVFVEAGAAKGLTLFMPGSHGDPIATKLLDAVASDKSIQAAAADSGLQIVKGDEYVDVITSDKRQAVNRFLKLPEIVDLPPIETLVFLGDSRNDQFLRGVDHPAVQIRIFVGTDRAFVQELGAPDDDHFIFLEGAFVDGTAFVLETLLGACPK